MFGLGYAKKGLEVAGFIEEDVVEEVLEEAPSLTTIKGPSKVTGTQLGPVKPFVKDPQQDYNHLVELFGVLGEPTKYIKCSCPGCEHEEEGLHSEYSSTAMDMTVACSECGHEDEFAEFYDETVTRFQTSRTPTMFEIFITLTNYDSNKYDPDDDYLEESLSGIRDSALKYYAILSGKAEIEHPGDRYGPMFLNHKGDYVVKHGHGWSSQVDDLIHFGKVKSLQTVRNQVEVDEDE